MLRPASPMQAVPCRSDEGEAPPSEAAVSGDGGGDTGAGELAVDQRPPVDGALLRAELESRRRDAEYLQILRTRRRRPSHSLLGAVVDVVEQLGLVVLAAGPGAEAELEVPQGLIDASALAQREARVLCVATSAVSVIGAAKRIEAERSGAQLTCMTTAALVRNVASGTGWPDATHAVVAADGAASAALVAALQRRGRIGVVLCAPPEHAEAAGGLLGARILRVP